MGQCSSIEDNKDSSYTTYLHEIIKDPTVIKPLDKNNLIHKLMENKKIEELRQVLKSDMIPRNSFTSVTSDGGTVLFSFWRYYMYDNIEIGKLLFKHPLIQSESFFKHNKYTIGKSLNSGDSLLKIVTNQITLDNFKSYIQMLGYFKLNSSFMVMVTHPSSDIYVIIAQLLNKVNGWELVPFDMAKYVSSVISLVPDFSITRLAECDENLMNTSIALIFNKSTLFTGCHSSVFLLRYPELCYGVFNNYTTPVDLKTIDPAIELVTSPLMISYLICRGSEMMGENLIKALQFCLFNEQISAIDTEVTHCVLINDKKTAKTIKVFGVLELMNHLLTRRFEELIKNPKILGVFFKSGYPMNIKLDMVKNNDLIIDDLLQRPLISKKIFKFLQTLQKQDWTYLSGKRFIAQPQIISLIDRDYPELILAEFRYDIKWILENMEYNLPTKRQIQQLIDQQMIKQIEGTECSICMVRSVSLFFKPCRHGACAECIVAWLMRNKNTCVCCSSVSSGMSYVHIFNYKTASAVESV